MESTVSRIMENVQETPRAQLETKFEDKFCYALQLRASHRKLQEADAQGNRSPLQVEKGKACQWNVSDMDGLFEEMFEKMLKEARQQFPVNDVTALIEEVYRNSNVIKKRQIEITVHPELQKIQMQPQNGKEVEMTQLNVFSFVKRIFVKTF